MVAGDRGISARVQLHQIHQEAGVAHDQATATLFIRTADPSDAGTMMAMPRPSGPDTVILGYLDGGVEVPLLAFDGRYLSAEVGESFVGRAYALVATAGTVAFDWLHYEGVDAPH